MSSELKYIPILRGLQEEIKVLKSFDFGQSIYPYVEIVKELDRLPPKPRKNAKKPSKPKPIKQFEHVYLPLIQGIKAQKVFVDLPVHIAPNRSMKDVILDFLQTVVANRKTRTDYMKKLAPLKSKVIPVISSYYARTNEPNSIVAQAKDLRSSFDVLAFRIFHEGFDRDIPQVESVLTSKDYLIVDWEDTPLDLSDDEQKEILKKIKTLKCNVIIHRNAIPNEITNVGLVHARVIDTIDNSLLEQFKDFSGISFSDYAGIKKPLMTKGGSVSPGFIYYDAVKNKFYGYKSDIKEWAELETTIVPAVITSSPSNRMHSDPLDYLGAGNIGWQILQSIYNEEESGKYPAVYKRIAVEHYLHCIKTKILNGNFD